MPDSQIEEIKSKVDIVNIIGEHVKLTKAGSNFRGLCPFHQEKSPSFMVSEELQIYKCFGCGEGGDVFTFLEKYEGMEFPEALKYLAEKADVKLVSSASQDNSKEILYEINALAAKFYNFLLVSHPVGKVALNYLKEERKINENLIKTFNIGFAPLNKNVLTDFLVKKKKFKLKDIEKAGLISLKNNIYERFNGRIIFPISDHRGNVIAFAGRQLPPGNPRSGKYINSPETPIYHKSNSLYGLNLTKDSIKKSGFVVVVEGEVDLISSFAVGIKNIVAIKGSAFTDGQASLLSRYTKEVVLALDTDFAGVAASIRGIKILEDAGFNVRVAVLGIYKDPDEAARGNPEFFKDKIDKAIPVWDFIIDSVVNKYNKETATGKKSISHELTPILAGINNKIVQEHYINKLAKLLEVSEVAVIEEVEKERVEEKVPEPTITKNAPSREETLVSLILKTSPELLKDKRIKDLLKTPILKRLAEEFDGNAKNLPKELFDKFAELKLFIQIEDKKDLSAEASAKAEINSIYKLLSLDDLKQKQMIESDEKKLRILQQKFKDFNSDNFERIIV
jgi:DNA primase